MCNKRFLFNKSPVRHKSAMHKKSLVVWLAMLVFVGCAPEVGSPEWCKKMGDKPSGEWTMNEATDYASHCLFK